MEIAQFVQFALKVYEIMLGVKGLIKGIKRGDDSFLMKISHDGSRYFLDLLQRRIQFESVAINYYNATKSAPWSNLFQQSLSTGT
jgi:hypothetical protein